MEEEEDEEEGNGMTAAAAAATKFTSTTLTTTTTTIAVPPGVVGRLYDSYLLYDEYGTIDNECGYDSRSTTRQNR